MRGSACPWRWCSTRRRKPGGRYGDGARPGQPPAYQEHRARLDPGGARGAVLPDHHRQDERGRHMNGRRPERAKALTAMVLASVILGMVGLTAAAVPLYRLFCQVTGYGGATPPPAGAPGGGSRGGTQASPSPPLGAPP